MTRPDPYPAGVDPAHILAIATTAPGSRRDGTKVLVGGRYAARVCLPTRSAAQAVHAALLRVGYQADRVSGGTRGRDVIVAGWNAEGLESRLTAMRAVLGKLAADPTATAVATLDQLGHLPATALPGPAGQRQFLEQTGEQLRAWIWGTSGIHAPSDPRARPADPGCALRLAATRQIEAAIDDLALRHAQVTEIALMLYPALRERMPHESARNIAIRRASMAFHFSPQQLGQSPQQLGQDLRPLLRSTGRAPGPAAAPDAAPPPVTSPGERPGTGPRAGRRTAQEFPPADRPTPRASRPPSTPGATRPRGRNFPSGRPGPRRR